jgi:uncharacterized membrane protein YeaQ/YmgE (transglycosylase-associated protein family)
VLPDAWLELIRPDMIVLAIVGVFWAALYSALFPPPLRGVVLVFLAGVAGAVGGQYLADFAKLRDVSFGDAHLLVASVGSLLGVVVVRRLVA